MAPLRHLGAGREAARSQPVLALVQGKMLDAKRAARPTGSPQRPLQTVLGKPAGVVSHAGWCFMGLIYTIGIEFPQRAYL